MRRRFLLVFAGLAAILIAFLPGVFGASCGDDSYAPSEVPRCSEPGLVAEDDTGTYYCVQQGDSLSSVYSSSYYPDVANNLSLAEHGDTYQGFLKANGVPSACEHLVWPGQKLYFNTSKDLASTLPSVSEVDVASPEQIPTSPYGGLPLPKDQPSRSRGSSSDDADGEGSDSGDDSPSVSEATEPSETSESSGPSEGGENASEDEGGETPGFMEGERTSTVESGEAWWHDEPSGVDLWAFYTDHYDGDPTYCEFLNWNSPRYPEHLPFEQVGGEPHRLVKPAENQARLVVKESAPSASSKLIGNEDLIGEVFTDSEKRSLRTDLRRFENQRGVHLIVRVVGGGYPVQSSRWRPYIDHCMDFYGDPGMNGVVTVNVTAGSFNVTRVDREFADKRGHSKVEIDTEKKSIRDAQSLHSKGEHIVSGVRRATHQLRRVKMLEDQEGGADRTRPGDESSISNEEFREEAYEPQAGPDAWFEEEEERVSEDEAATALKSWLTTHRVITDGSVPDHVFGFGESRVTALFSDCDRVQDDELWVQTGGWRCSLLDCLDYERIDSASSLLGLPGLTSLSLQGSGVADSDTGAPPASCFPDVEEQCYDPGGKVNEDHVCGVVDAHKVHEGWASDAQFTGSDPDRVVLHHTGSRDLSADEQRFQAQGLSSHFIINREGAVVQYLPLSAAAEHAGVANNHTISVELVSTGFNGYSDAQYKALDALLDRLTPLLKGSASPEVIGHYEVCEYYEDDTGENYCDGDRVRSGKWDPSPDFEWFRIGHPRSASLMDRWCQSTPDYNPDFVEATCYEGRSPPVADAS